MLHLKKKIILNLQKYNVTRNENIHNLFLVIHDTEKHSLSLEISKNNVFSKIKEVFLLLLQIFGKVY